jgi:tyrosyl-DNA phosphodiesterase-1
MRWGCHHTKLFLVGYKSGRLRVIVHTANMCFNDIHLKCQGAFLQDFPLKISSPQPQPQQPVQRRGGNGGRSSSSSPCDFEETLVSYIQTYHFHQERVWSKTGTTGGKCTLVQQLRKYDYSNARAVLIPSTPGYHKIVNKDNLGYLKVRKAIANHTTPSPLPDKGRKQTPRPIVCQYSSIGALSAKYLKIIESAWDTASVHHNTPPLLAAGPHNLQLVYPTVDEIRQSVEGLAGGGSVPGRQTNVNRKFLTPLYHKWSSSVDLLQKARNVPHIKTYYQLGGGEGGDEDSMDWFVLSSHNLSKGKYSYIIVF